MENSTPAVRKQTVWMQILSLVSVLLATLTENVWFMENFSQTGGYALMVYNATAIILSFTRPLPANYKKNLEILDPKMEDDDV